MDVLLTADGAVAGGRVRTFMLEKSAPPRRRRPESDRSTSSTSSPPAACCRTADPPRPSAPSRRRPPPPRRSPTPRASTLTPSTARDSLSSWRRSTRSSCPRKRNRRSGGSSAPSCCSLRSHSRTTATAARVADDEKLRAGGVRLPRLRVAAALTAIASPRGGTTYAIALDVRRAATARFAHRRALPPVFDSSGARQLPVVGATRTEAAPPPPRSRRAAADRRDASAQGEGKGRARDWAARHLRVRVRRCERLRAALHQLHERAFPALLPPVHLRRRGEPPPTGGHRLDEGPLPQLTAPRAALRPPAAIFPMLDSVRARRKPPTTHSSFVPDSPPAPPSAAAAGAADREQPRAKSRGAASPPAPAVLATMWGVTVHRRRLRPQEHRATLARLEPPRTRRQTPPRAPSSSTRIPLPGLAAALGPDVAGAALPPPPTNDGRRAGLASAAAAAARRGSFIGKSPGGPCARRRASAAAVRRR